MTALPHEPHPARIAPLDEWDEATDEVLRATLADPAGEPLAIFRTLARHPRLLKRFNLFGGAFLARGELPARERELVILRTAWRTGAEYEWGQHARLGADAGLSGEEIAAVASDGPGSWSTDDHQLLAFTDELLARCDVGGERWSEQRSRWSDAQLIELICLIGFYRMVAGFLTTLGVQLEPGVDGWPAG